MGKMYKCPSCQDYFVVEDYYEEGEVITCDVCNNEFIIIKLNPLKLRKVDDDE